MLGEEKHGEVAEKTGLGNVGEDALPYNPDNSFSEDSSASENGKKSKHLFQQVANDNGEVARLLDELEKLKGKMVWLDGEVTDFEEGFELILLVGSGESFDYWEEVILEAKQHQLTLLRRRNQKLKVLGRVVERVKTQNKAFEMEIPKRWSKWTGTGGPNIQARWKER